MVRNFKSWLFKLQKSDALIKKKTQNTGIMYNVMKMQQKKNTFE